MDLDAPDPARLRIERDRANLRLAATLAIGFVAFLWFVQLTNWATDVDVGSRGNRPREPDGLIGIVLAPLVHGSFEHLIANSGPLIVLGTVMLYLYPTSAPAALPAVYVGSGAAVWLAARGGAHVGASGLIYGLAAYVLVAGLIRRDRRAIAASLIVFFLYGALVWGVLPIERGVSWESHLAGALIGAAMAIALRHRDLRPPARDDRDDATTDDDDAAGETPPDER
jgi:membrane associated rhomboid family serine protease